MLLIISSVCLIHSNYNDKHCIIHVALSFLQYIIYICLINSSTELTLVSQPIIIFAKSVQDSLKNYLYFIMSFKKRSNNLSDIVSSGIPRFGCFPSHLHAQMRFNVLVFHRQAGVWPAEVAQGQERWLVNSHSHNSRQPQQVFLLKPHTFPSQVTVRCLTEEMATGMLSRGHTLIKAGI